jgi:hypothetical protein
MPDPQPRSSGPGPGRPLSLDPEQQRQILAFVAAGSSVDAAAQAAGIAPRTLRELRQRARGEHPTRSALPKLKPFFEDLSQAVGRQIVKSEIWLSEHDPKDSLRYLRARNDIGADDPEPVRLPTVDELQGELEVLISAKAFTVPPCPDATCSCAWHSSRGREE